ncbi:hypothetical protein LguiB_026740 [Lonicera macranthoides]
MVEVLASLELALTLQSRKDSAFLDDDIFDFGGTSHDQEMVQSEVINAVDFKQENIVPADSALDASEGIPKDEQGLQNQDGGVDDDYKDSSGIEEKIGGRKVEIDDDIIRHIFGLLLHSAVDRYVVNKVDNSMPVLGLLPLLEIFFKAEGTSKSWSLTSGAAVDDHSQPGLFGLRWFCCCLIDFKIAFDFVEV